MSITTKIEVITPARAKQLLEKNSSNRPVRRAKVDKYARAIEKGEWKITNQGLGLNCDGTLLDGQHRLLAVIKSGLPVKMNVTRGLDRSAMFGVDIGANRDVADIAKVAGVSVEITKAMVSTARSMIDSLPKKQAPQSAAYTHEEIIEFIVTHHDSISYACSLDLGKIGCSPFRAVAARAWYTVDRNQLNEFFTILGTGYFKDEDGVWPIKLREYFLSCKGITGGFPFRRMLYAKTQRALQKFLDRSPFTMLKESQDELYPLPNETAELAEAV